MELDISESSLPVYEALASQVRLNMIQLLAKQPMNIRELAEALGLSSAIMTMHVKKLEKAKLISTRMVPGKGGVQKICSIAADKIEITMPVAQDQVREFHQTEVPVGHYTDFDIVPTCGLATIDHIIGEFDEPRYFWDAERVHARILWFGQGFIEYKVPNFLLSSQRPEELEISMEISSEAPFTNDNWPSDLSFYLNDIHLGTWTSPGDFGDKPGKYTPSWWPSVVNQYGLLKRLRITQEGTFMDGHHISNVNLDQLSIEHKQWTFRIAVLNDAQHIGGATLFGTGFGNYNQDILFKLFYTQETQQAKS
ncbi:ArsR/SmtB family transcription factor [Paenibacillus crassostreae]|uniref:ArsR family transcriptional regulator n=1 Tax=Paenibacillus crassostreae TaxID=1763538 RepID=A0A162RJP0_9BACL|nr:ArsR family transcriptional regulator [Paenibacillus crassostreae]AOZ92488.1 transcriptional regulator [Paenibacillus crassostreae]OAB72437.1 ArsR family transcriptional regulator [Paenibacillus crassostreae]